jgi:hypothetical protein
VTYRARSIDLTVRDRGPCYHWNGMTCTRPVGNRCFDLDDDAFRYLTGSLSAGVVPVTWRKR